VDELGTAAQQTFFHFLDIHLGSPRAEKLAQEQSLAALAQTLRHLQGAIFQLPPNLHRWAD
jgi:hypothetical protein